MNQNSFKKRIKRYIPPLVFTAVQAGKKNVAKLRRMLVPQKPYRPGTYPFGVNLAGFIRAEMGLGQSCRCLATALEAGNIPFSVIAYQHGACARMGDSAWEHKMQGIRYAVNLTVINADQLDYAVPILGKEYWNGQYQIAHYAWELSEYPKQWAGVSRRFQEIWTPSTFCTQAVAAAVHCPVYTVPYVIEPNIETPRARAWFGLPEEGFLFLCMFDVSSVIQRKNPQGAIDAFIRAFGHSRPDVGLVIKVNDPRRTPGVQEYLNKLRREYPNIYLLDTVLSRNDTNALIQVCDCFVSMHRSEGFGLVMAEAMYLEKPVIATNWSSNTDFMTGENSCPVSYRLIEADRDYAVYKKGQLWADPDVADCARYMQRLVDDPGYYETIAKAGSAAIRQKYSREAAAQALRDRLAAIEKMGQ